MAHFPSLERNCFTCMWPLPVQNKYHLTDFHFPSLERNCFTCMWPLPVQNKYNLTDFHMK